MATVATVELGENNMDELIGNDDLTLRYIPVNRPFSYYFDMLFGTTLCSKSRLAIKQNMVHWQRGISPITKFTKIYSPNCSIIGYYIYTQDYENGLRPNTTICVFNTHVAILHGGSYYTTSTINEGHVEDIEKTYRKFHLTETHNQLKQFTETCVNDDVCAICLETLNDCVETRCKHKFHKKCMFEILTQKCKCPLCNADI